MILASNNAHKLEEFRAIFADMGIEIIPQSAAGCRFEVDENGTTFAENAYLKAKAVADATGEITVADDSGLMVDALNGEPGIYSARYGFGHDASDAERNRYLLGKLGNEKNRRARFVCCVCCCLPDGNTITARGECEGEILDAPRGSNGFGYDPLFRPLGYDVSMAELSADEKNAISHRGKAMRKFIEKFKRYYNGIDK